MEDISAHLGQGMKHLLSGGFKYSLGKKKKKKGGQAPLTGWFRNELVNHYGNQRVILSKSVPSKFYIYAKF